MSIMRYQIRRSLTGAWIETVRDNSHRILPAVAPLRGRGLKQVGHASLYRRILSLPYGGVD